MIQIPVFLTRIVSLTSEDLDFKMTYSQLANRIVRCCSYCMICSYSISEIEQACHTKPCLAKMLVNIMSHVHWRPDSSLYVQKEQNTYTWSFYILWAMKHGYAKSVISPYVGYKFIHNACPTRVGHKFGVFDSLSKINIYSQLE